MNRTVKEARVAGLIYLSMVLIAPIGLIYLPGKLIVPGNASATAANFLDHQALARWWIIMDLWAHVIFICLGVALYRLLSRVSKTWALLMVALVLVSAAVGFFNVLNSVAGLLLFRGPDFLSALDQTQRETLGMFFLRLHSHGNFINEIFWGLWLFPFGLLVFRSAFLPRFIGVWLIAECFAWLVLSPMALFWPRYYDSAFRYSQPLLWAELAIMIWLLKGPKLPQSRSVTFAPAT